MKGELTAIAGCDHRHCMPLPLESIAGGTGRNYGGEKAIAAAGLKPHLPALMGAAATDAAAGTDPLAARDSMRNAKRVTACGIRC